METNATSWNIRFTFKEKEQFGFDQEKSYTFVKNGIMGKLLNAYGIVDRNRDTADGVIYENSLLYLSLAENEDGKKYSDIQFDGKYYRYGADRKTQDTTNERLCRTGEDKLVYQFDLCLNFFNTYLIIRTTFLHCIT